ncbi:hypothetical protein N8642_04880, partial [bacterium]|nr:hypothetical protein [bacterium]
LMALSRTFFAILVLGDGRANVLVSHSSQGSECLRIASFPQQSQERNPSPTRASGSPQRSAVNLDALIPLVS